MADDRAIGEHQRSSAAITMERRESNAGSPKWEDAHLRATAPPACDFCGSPRSPLERQRVLWNSGASTELVLADLCSRCAAEGDRLLDLYGRSGRDALRISRKTRAMPVRAAPARTLGRVLLYLLIAFAAFVLVTLISSLR